MCELDLRISKDSLGEVEVPAKRLYGAQTARSLNNFNLGSELMPKQVIKALLLIKLAAAEINGETVKLPQGIAQAISYAATFCLKHFNELAAEFPLHVWQTGSGTQTNMNVNEVLANLATIYLDLYEQFVISKQNEKGKQYHEDGMPTEALEGKMLKLDAINDTNPVVDIATDFNALAVDLEEKLLSLLDRPELSQHLKQARWKIHPNDHVNCGQSSNDTFPSAMYIAAYLATQTVIAEAKAFSRSFNPLITKYQDTIKCGRTHLQDAVPISFAQELSGWQSLVDEAVNSLNAVVAQLTYLALGGTACGTGLNTQAGFNQEVCKRINLLLKNNQESGITQEQADVNNKVNLLGVADMNIPIEFQPAPNLFAALSGKSALVAVHGALTVLASNLFKIANDIRYLASGPRCGYGELVIPANEPGSSIMPGKVNPTQCEAMTMIATQVIANHQAISMAASQGQFQLNVYMPVLIYNFLQSCELLCEVMPNFAAKLLVGLTANADKMQENFERSLMNVTALAPKIGYNQAAEVAKKALKEQKTLKEVVVSELKLLDINEYEQIIDPLHLAYPHAN